MRLSKGMGAPRLTPLIVAIIGAVLCIASVVGIVMGLISPTQQKIQAANARISAVGSDASKQARDAANLQLANAKTTVATTQTEWIKKQSALMPPYDVSHRTTAWHQISHELAENLGPNIERWIPRTGVVSLSDAITIAPPPASPNLVTNAPLIIPINGGTLSVGGDFRSILSHILQWNNFNRLVLIDKLALTGTSPHMKGTYAASVIIFPQNAEKIDKPVAAAGGGGASTGFGASPGGSGRSGPGGPPGGFPGGPPGGPPR